ncbi:hypothetical protein Tco_0729272 [Tanacetum coccineum]|uniref:Uncharacterized protein n=1 Tax=Tanacetum coccineum TaxID=301880 RepID=A0ABQ4YPP7_9ASTR
MIPGSLSPTRNAMESRLSSCRVDLLTVIVSVDCVLVPTRIWSMCGDAFSPDFVIEVVLSKVVLLMLCLEAYGHEYRKICVSKYLCESDVFELWTREIARRRFPVARNCAQDALSSIIRASYRGSSVDKNGPLGLEKLPCSLVEEVDD